MGASPGPLPRLIEASAAPVPFPASPSSSMPPSRWSARHPLGRAVRLGVVVAALAAAVFTEIPLCPFALVTRHPCPGCGLTRATLALLHGHLGEALGFHPLS